MRSRLRSKKLNIISVLQRMGSPLITKKTKSNLCIHTQAVALKKQEHDSTIVLNEQLDGYRASYRAKEHTVATTQRANIALLKVDQRANIASLKVDQRANIASLKVDLKSNYRDQLKDTSSRLLTQKDEVIRGLRFEMCLM